MTKEPNVNTTSTKSTLNKARKLFDTRNPVVVEYLTYGPIRLKKNILKAKRYYRRMDEQTVRHERDDTFKKSFQKQVDDDNKVIDHIKSLPLPYVVVLNHQFRAVTDKDLERARVGLRGVQKIRNKNLRKAVKADLSQSETRILRNALGANRAPRGDKTVFKVLKRKLGLN